MAKVLRGELAQEALRLKWGEEAYATRLQVARRVLANLSEAQLGELEAAIGTRALLEAAGDLALHYDPLLQHDALPAEVALDALRAGAELSGLKSDREAMARYVDGDASVRDEMSALLERATPERVEPEPGDGGDGT